jgi:hypothetical protein
MLEEYRLGDLDPQVAGREVRLRKDGLNVGDKRGLTELAAR